MKDWYSIYETALILNVKIQDVRRLLRDGRLKCHINNFSYRIDKESLEKYVGEGISEGGNSDV